MNERIKRRTVMLGFWLGMMSLGCGSGGSETGSGDASGVVPGKPDHGFTADNVFALVPGAYPDTISLPDVIRGLKSDSAVEKLANRIKEYVKQAVGIELVLPKIGSIKADPERFADMLQFSLEDMAAGRRLLLSGNIRFNQPAQGQSQLPQSFDYENAGSVPLALPTTDLKELVAGQLYQGWPRDLSVPDEVCRTSTILSEVFERLSSNLHLAQDQRFSVTYKGVSYQTLDAFVAALVSSGHEITAEVRHAVANFTGLHARGSDGALHPVASPAFAATGILDSQKKEAVLPMFHSELVFRVRPTHAAPAEAIQADVLFYQGVSRMGFYGAGCAVSPAWVGSKVSDRLDQATAIKVLDLTGHFTSVIRVAAEKNKLSVHGYAVLGVCNDSVAIIQQAVHGKVSSWPLFMLDELVLPELDQRLAAGQDVALYQALRQAVESSPSDASDNPTSRERALTSISWELGYEPFLSTLDARRILGSAN